MKMKKSNLEFVEKLAVVRKKYHVPHQAPVSMPRSKGTSVS
jgi:hypothetical protein